MVDDFLLSANKGLASRYVQPYVNTYFIALFLSQETKYVYMHVYI